MQISARRLEIMGLVLIIGGIMALTSITYHESYAQPRGIPQTIVAELEESEFGSFGGQTYYNVDNVYSNATYLEDIESTGGLSSYVIADETRISPNIQLKVPLIEDPNRSEVKTITTTLKVDSIEEKNRNSAIYYGTPEFDSGTIYGYDVYEGILEQTGGDEAILIFVLE